MINTSLILNTSGVQKVVGPAKNLKPAYLVGTDTRNFKAGEFFLAIKGETFDGFGFVDQVIEKTDLVVFEDNVENNKKLNELQESYPQKVFVIVDNSIKYTQELAAGHVKDWLKQDGKEVIAIAGSNGKTTTKEMLWHILSEVNSKNVTRTLKNNNNHLGVPFTLFQINNDIDFAVVEYGSNHPGEMKVICDCSFPTIGVTTNIGDTHMEFFDDLKAVFKEEALVYEYIKKSQTGKKLFFRNTDDPLLKNLEDDDFVKSYGFEGSPEYKFSFNRQESSISVNSQKLINKNILGKHNFLNLAVSYLIATELYPNKNAELISACSSFIPRSNRSEWRDWNGSRLFLDAYNANPSSMKQAASEFYEAFVSQAGNQERCLMLIGDMNELGDRATQYHSQLGEFFTSFDRADVIFLGRYNKDFETGYKGNLLISKSDTNLTESELKSLQNHSWIFAKASRSLQLESLFAIKERST